MTTPDTTKLPLYGECEFADNATIEAVNLASRRSPLPVLYDIGDRRPGERRARIVGGVIFPFGGGAVHRQRLPGHDAPLYMGRFEIWSSIAEAMQLHRRRGGRTLATMDPCRTHSDPEHQIGTSPEAFAVRDDAGDVTEWGCWYPDRAVTWTPPVTAISGREQYARHTVWRGVPDVHDMVAARSGAGRVVWLSSIEGRALAEDVRRVCDLGLRRHDQQVELARAAGLLGDADLLVDPLATDEQAD